LYRYTEKNETTETVVELLQQLEDLEDDLVMKHGKLSMDSFEDEDEEEEEEEEGGEEDSVGAVQVKSSRPIA
jgi:hypothetical protein